MNLTIVLRLEEVVVVEEQGPHARVLLSLRILANPLIVGLLDLSKVRDLPSESYEGMVPFHHAGNYTVVRDRDVIVVPHLAWLEVVELAGVYRGGHVVLRDSTLVHLLLLFT